MSKDLEEGKAGRMRYWGVDKCGGGRQPRGDRGEILSQSTTRKKKKRQQQGGFVREHYLVSFIYIYFFLADSPGKHLGL